MKKLTPLLVVVALGLVTPAMAQVEYYTLDALGSVRVVTDEAGALVARHDYLPFGEECLTVPCPGPIQAANDEQAKRFTGQERDKETGLDYFGARYYEAGTARFDTVDPVLNKRAALADPQRWNRYAYARDNPYSYVDPDGRDLKPRPDSNWRFILYFNRATQHAAVAGAAAAIKALEGKPDVYVYEGQGDPNKSGGNAYNPGPNTIEWWPTWGIVSADGTTSAMLALIHEAIHARHDLEDPGAYRTRQDADDPNYDNAEEKLTTEEEWQAADRLGEPRMHDHKGRYYPTADSDTTEPAPVPY